MSRIRSTDGTLNPVSTFARVLMSAPQKPKRHHHHVWQNYLRPWTVNGALYCLLDLEAGRQIETGRTKDHKEAARAFVEKRALCLLADD